MQVKLLSFINCYLIRKLGKVVKSHPTIGSNYEEIQRKNIHLQTWDLGGQESLRKIWECYYKGAQGIIYVIDSSDRNSFETSKKELRQLFTQEEIKDSVFLILANKQDLENSIGTDEIIEEFGLKQIEHNTWSIYGISVLKNTGIEPAFEWLTEQLKKNQNQAKS